MSRALLFFLCTIPAIAAPIPLDLTGVRTGPVTVAAEADMAAASRSAEMRGTDFMTAQ
ncbi:MAG: hypothetical protein H7Y20_05920 [Bryobacteraceae bacterium]|nr:hypothetical protein [Bryobacteraceae bacterium]